MLLVIFSNPKESRKSLTPREIDRGLLVALGYDNQRKSLTPREIDSVQSSFSWIKFNCKSLTPREIDRIGQECFKYGGFA